MRASIRGKDIVFKANPAAIKKAGKSQRSPSASRIGRIDESSARAIARDVLYGLNVLCCTLLNFEFTKKGFKIKPDAKHPSIYAEFSFDDIHFRGGAALDFIEDVMRLSGAIHSKTQTSLGDWYMGKNKLKINTKSGKLERA